MQSKNSRGTVRGLLPMPAVRSSDLLSVAVVTGDPELSQQVRSSMRELPVHVAFEVPMLRPRQELLQRLQSAAVGVVLLDLETVGGIAEPAVRDIKSVLPNCYVVALGKGSDPESILSAFRAGCSDYLYSPVQHGLTAALGRIAGELSKQKKTSAAPGASMLGFLSAKGGCGATTIACHVAAELRRLTSEKLLLADLDLTAGTVGFLMNAEKHHHILEAVWNTNRLDSSFWGALVSDCGGLDVVPAPEPMTERPDPAAVSETLRFIRGQYRLVLADLGRGLNPFVETAIDEMDRVFLVTTAERPALHQAKLIAEYFTEKRSPRVDTRLIVNRVPHKRPDLAVADCADFVGIPLCCEISSEYPTLYEACVSGKLVSGRSRLGKDFSHAARMIARLSNEDEQQPSFSLTPAWLRAATSFLR
jgi:pilus assembly protein CpaE